MSHQRISELLPWYVNGTLSLGDRQAAALETASCDECAKETDDLTRAQAAILEMDAAAPEPDERAFARALAAVEEEERRRRLGHPWLGWWWALAPFRRAVVVSAALLLPLAVTIALLGRGHFAPATVAVDQNPTPVAFERLSEVQAKSVAPPMASRTVVAAAPALQATGSVVSSAASAASGVLLAQTGDVALVVPDVEKAIAAIESIARAQSGAVLSLDDRTPSSPGERHTAHLDLMVPQARFDAAVQGLGGLGGMKSRSVSAANLGGQIVNSEARLRNLRRAETDYLRIMDRAGSIDDVLAVQNQVSATREQIEELEGQVASLRHQVAFSTIAVDLEDEAQAVPATVSALARMRDAWAAALRSVEDFSIALVAAALYGVAYAPYVLVAALIGGFIAGRFRRSG